MSINVAVLLIAFRRPIETQQTVQKILAQKPASFYCWIDAPRNADEAKLVREVEAVVNWEAEAHGVTVTVLRNEQNEGMTRAFGRAIDWFFSHVDEGIIIEDDCAVGEDFVAYCAELLERYRDDMRVLAIMGDNAAGGKILGRSSYAFVPDFSVWGWATWKRVWELYDYELTEWPLIRAETKRLRKYWPNRIQRLKWVQRFDQLFEDDGTLQESNWRFMLIGLKTMGLFVLPRRNLVTNIGIDENLATSGSRGHIRTMHEAQSIMPMRHPRAVRASWWANRTLFFSRKRRNRQATFWFPLKKELRTVIKSLVRRFRET